MGPVITISLNGNAYTLEQAAYDALKAYLATAEARLAANPDRAEILADLEQAIAEKCGRYLSAHKTVVATAEVEEVIREMGPVDAADEPPAQGEGMGAAAGASGAPRAGAAPLRRLYRIREGAMLGGVCNGLAAYFDIDVAVVRVIFVLLAIVTWGLWSLAYLVMMFVIPHAKTTEQHAAAHGSPLNAQDVIDRAKRHYAEYRSGRAWRREWREQRRRSRSERRRYRAYARAYRQAYRSQWTAPGPRPWPQAADGAGALANAFGGLIMAVASLVSALLSVLLLLAIVSLVMKRAVLGWTLPPHLPLWAAIVILVVIYSVLVSPLRFVRHFGSVDPFVAGWQSLWRALAWIAVLVLLAWLAREHWPAVQSALRHLTAGP